MGLSCLFSTTATAKIEESSTSTNSFLYYFGDPYTLPMQASADNMQFDMNPRKVEANGAISEIGMSMDSVLLDGSFNFLHNAYCIGKCQIELTTKIVFTLKNTGTETEYLRFDSLITPGHMAEANASGTAFGNFAFNVRQTQSLDSGALGTDLYNAWGDTSFPAISTTEPLLGFTHIDNGQEYQIFDWSATPLNLALQAILPNETHYLIYSSTVTMSNLSGFACSDLSSCPGIQIAFGDPRNQGGGSGGRMAFASVNPLEPIIGRQFVATESYVNVVPTTAALPNVPALLPPTDYGPKFPTNFTSAIPEPASWMMMIGGFALIGGSARRRASVEALRPV